MEFIPFKKIARLSRPILITEKIDGTCGVIGITEAGGLDCDGYLVQPRTVVETDAGPIALYAGSRNRWVSEGNATDNYGFSQFVKENAVDLLKLGPGRHYGEWFGRGINRGYGLSDRRFSLFNVSRWCGPDRGGAPDCCSTVPILYEGEFSTEAINFAIGWLEDFGSMAVPGFDKPEGIVVWHSAGNLLLKKTLIDDAAPKSAAAVAA